MIKNIFILVFLFLSHAIFSQDLDPSASGGKYKGTYKDGKRNGRGTFIWSDGTKYVGQWADDLMDGYGTLTLPDGTKYVGYWKNGQREGFGTFTWANGDVYQGQFKNNKKHGDGILKMKDGSEYTGQWANDMANGKGTFIWANKTKYIGEWKDNKRHGQGVTISVSGKIEQGNYDNDRYIPCSCPPNEQFSVEEAYEKFDAVFVGKITAFAGEMANVKILQYWKGEILDEISVIVKIGYSSCDWIYFQDESYLFYAKKVSNGIYYTNLCTRTAKLKDALADVKVLEQKIPCIDKTQTSPITSSSVTGYVCGCDGNSYRSPNEARKNGVQTWKLGLCGNKK